MNEILKERIQLRMHAKGMNPSSVALEAGLSRSTVRDILSGKAKNPGMMTIHAIAKTLDCSDNYLMGYTDEPYWAEATDILVDVFARTNDISGILEAGVFRQITEPSPGLYLDTPHFFGEDQDKRASGSRELKALRSAHRFIGRDLYMYQMGDWSLDQLHIIKGDFVTAVSEPADERGERWPNLKDGMIVVSAVRVEGISAEELSARLVKKTASGFTLSTASNQTKFADIEIIDKASKSHTFTTKSGTIVTIEGVVVNLTRPISM